MSHVKHVRTEQHKSDTFNQNYAAKLFILPEFHPIAKADKLVFVEIDNTTVIIPKDFYTVGEVVLYIPVGSEIYPILASKLNLYRTNSKNADSQITGYLEDNGVVKSIKLRGVSSNGLIIKISSIGDAYEMKIEFDELRCELDSPFDTLILNEYETNLKYVLPICTKFIPFAIREKIANKKKQKLNEMEKQDKSKKYNTYVTLDKLETPENPNGKFKFHPSTPNLERHITSGMEPDNSYWITEKLHGTSVVLANIPVKKSVELSYLGEKWLLLKHKVKALYNKVLGKPQEKFELPYIIDYGDIYSSRQVIRNRCESKTDKLSSTEQRNMHIQTDNIWGIINVDHRHKIPHDYIVYGEIVGFNPTGSPIQVVSNTAYDYGCTAPWGHTYEENKHYKLFVYRVSYNGKDLSPWQTQMFCATNKFNMVPILQKDYTPPTISNAVDNTKQVDAKQTLRELANYLNVRCPISNNPVVREGIVLSSTKLPTHDVAERYKLISPKYRDNELHSLTNNADHVDPELEN